MLTRGRGFLCGLIYTPAARFVCTPVVLTFASRAKIACTRLLSPRQDDIFYWRRLFSWNRVGKPRTRPTGILDVFWKTNESHVGLVTVVNCFSIERQRRNYRNPSCEPDIIRMTFTRIPLFCWDDVWFSRSFSPGSSGIVTIASIE